MKYLLVIGLNSFTITGITFDSTLTRQEYSRITNEDSIIFVSNYSSEIIAIGEDTISYGSKERHYAFQGMRPFFYKNELYSIGGYGFWRINPYLLKFNKNSGWQAIEIKKDYTPVINPEVVVTDSLLILIGGNKFAKNSLIDFVQNPVVQIINMKTLNLVNELKFYDLNTSEIRVDKNENHILIIGQNAVATINIKRWTISEYKLNPANLDIFINYENFKVDNNKLIINDNYIFEDEVNQSKLFYIIYIILVLIVLLLIMLYVRKKDYGQQSILESTKHFNFPDFLRQLNERGEMRHVELFDFIGSDLSYSHKSRIIRESIECWNIVLVKEFDLTEPVIIRQKNELDKRSLKYVMSKVVEETNFNKILDRVNELSN
jgi:hypothetical protein